MTGPTVGKVLVSGTAQLQDAGVGSARLDCLILLEDATGRDRAWLLAHPEYKLTSPLLQELEEKLKRREAHEPLAYIRCETEFYGREFYVDFRVLEPRPESETMIDLLKTLGLPQGSVIVDAGTGSGALAITAKLEFPSAKVIATDIDAGCLAVARRNAATLQADVRFLQADLLDIGLKKIDVILANLPYVPDNFTINRAAMNEPRLAIFGGPDGLDVYRRMFGQIMDMTDMAQKPAYILAESLPPQHGKLAGIAASAGYNQLQEQDFVQVFAANKQ